MSLPDADLLAMLAKLDAVDWSLAAAPRRGCSACRREDWYDDSHPAQRVCRTCHPPKAVSARFTVPTVRADVDHPREEPTDD
ncbi:MAG: hypothetical protein KDB73_15445 [Planctomycetes bacterium]|nr:hypothetical protein [Planctomycetota bacterium]